MKVLRWRTLRLYLFSIAFLFRTVMTKAYFILSISYIEPDRVYVKTIQNVQGSVNDGYSYSRFLQVNRRVLSFDNTYSALRCSLFRSPVWPVVVAIIISQAGNSVARAKDAASTGMGSPPEKVIRCAESVPTSVLWSESTPIENMIDLARQVFKRQLSESRASQ